MIGEYSGAGYANNAGELGTGTMDALLDFDFNDFAQNFVTGKISSVENSLQKRNSAINNTAVMGIFKCCPCRCLYMFYSIHTIIVNAIF